MSSPHHPKLPYPLVFAVFLWIVLSNTLLADSHEDTDTQCPPEGCKQIDLSSMPSSTPLENQCAPPTIQPDLSIVVPCAGVAGKQYAGRLSPTGEAFQEVWQVSEFQQNTSCHWSPLNCATLGLDGSLVVPSLRWLDGNYTAVLPLTDKGWTYGKHVRMNEGAGSIGSHGSLPPLPPALPGDGQGKKLLAIYMVGSDLESGPVAAATRDLKELRDGYKDLQAAGKADEVEVVVAFGGSDKDGWRGIKIARMEDIVADLDDDGEMGSLPSYPYEAPLAHMGDVSTFRLFLDFLLRQNYVNYSQRFLAFWDHGASYGGIGFDEYYRHDPLSLSEVEQALAGSGTRFDVIGFDACLMASMETARYIQAYADYMVASEELEPGHGWQWADVLDAYANGTDVVAMATQLVDKYIQEHDRTTGKTMSVVNLREFSSLKQTTDAWLRELLNQVATGGDQSELVYSAINHAMDKAQVYGGGTSVDLQNMVMEVTAYLQTPSLKDLAKAVYAALEQYVVYTTQDGSRPGSYGVTVNLPVNRPQAISLSPAVDEVQRLWEGVQAADTRPPAVTNEESGTVFDFGAMEPTISADVSLALDILLSGDPVCADAKEILLDLGIDPAAVSPEQRDYLYEVRDFLDSDMGFDEKMADIGQALCASCDDIAPYLSAYIFMPRGVFPRNFPAPEPEAVTGLCGRDTNMRRLRIAASQTPPFLRGERAGLVYQPNKGRNLRSALTDGNAASGTTASFSDDKPIQVTTVYGNLDYFNNFHTVAELEAYPTQEPGKFFTPVWNRKWYQLTYDPESPDAWVPFVFQQRYRENDQTFTRYAVEIQYQDADVIYPDPEVGFEAAVGRTYVEAVALITDANSKASAFCSSFGMDYFAELMGKNAEFTAYRCAHRAQWEVVMDEDNHMVSQKVVPLLQQVGVDGTEFTLPDKLARDLKVGDRISFLYQVAPPGNTGKATWEMTPNEMIRITQPPLLRLEVLAFVDSTKEGQDVPFYYRMKATDVTGTSVYSLPQRAIAEMPDCPTLEGGLLYLKQAENALQRPEATLSLADENGKQLNDAVAIMKLVAEASGPSEFSSKVAELASYLYSGATFLGSAGSWDWSKVEWQKAKQPIIALIPLFEEIYTQQGCDAKVSCRRKNSCCGSTCCTCTTTAACNAGVAC